jgi:hypothetical protein
MDPSNRFSSETQTQLARAEYAREQLAAIGEYAREIGEQAKEQKAHTAQVRADARQVFSSLLEAVDRRRCVALKRR